jgi:CubicO group peptidase (beta-lactamase class C family)
VAAARHAVGHDRPTLENWLEPANRAWAFRHVRELIPSARIRRGAQMRHLAADPIELDDTPVLGGRLSLVDYLHDANVSGFLVLQSGAIRYERYRNGLTPETPHLLMSVSKSIVASVTGILVGAGQLGTSDKLSDILPELRNSAWEAATVDHLLDMRAGIRFDESDDDPNSDLPAYEQIYQWRPLRQELPSDIRHYMRNLPSDQPHGTEFRYQSIHTDMLAWVLEAVTGQRISDLISELLWQPMGAGHDAEVTIDRHGNAHADGGISATLRDVALFGESWRTGKAWNGQQLLPPRWIQQTIHPGASPSDGVAESARENANSYYSRNWWIIDAGRPLYAARGYCGQAVYVDPPAEAVIVLLSAWPRHTPDREQDVVEVVRSVTQALSRT